MDALIKPLRSGKPSDINKASDIKSSNAKAAGFSPAQLDPSEFMAAVQPNQQRPSRHEAEDAVRTLLAYIGENPDREGLLDTPRRVIESYDEIYQGYHQCPAEVLNRTFGETAGYDDFVLVRDRADRRGRGRGAQAARRRRDDRGGAYLHVGARRRQAWRDDRHQPVHRLVPR